MKENRFSEWEWRQSVLCVPSSTVSERPTTGRSASLSKAAARRQRSAKPGRSGVLDVSATHGL